MRDFLNTILLFIGSESLTDDEFDSIVETDQVYSNEVYLALHDILINRESVSSQTDKLYYFFKAKGTDLSQATDPQSNFFVGSEL